VSALVCIYIYICVCVCVCVRARARAHVITAATADLYAILKGKKSTGYTASQLLHLENMAI